MWPTSSKTPRTLATAFLTGLASGVAIARSGDRLGAGECICDGGADTGRGVGGADCTSLVDTSLDMAAARC
jgi:hypothetical protein